MIDQIWKLSKIQLCNIFGFNQMRFTKDKKKKNKFIGMSIVWGFLFLLLWFYIVVFSGAMVVLGLGEIIPMYMFLICSIITFVFSVLKAGNVIFQMDSYEMLTSLPVSKSAIILSRFISMYITDLILSFLVIVPGMVIYAIQCKVSALFFIFGFLGILFLPMIPITVATAIGSLAVAISSRMKYKSIVTAVLSLLFTGVIFVFYIKIPNEVSNISENVMKNLVQNISKQVEKIYMPAMWFQKAVISGSWKDMILLILVSVGIFTLLIVLLQKYFGSICSALNVSFAKNNYKMGQLKQNSIWKALLFREVKKYFSSSAYVVNTMVGYIMMAGFSIAICITGIDKTEKMLELPGLIGSIYPFVLALLATLMPTTACTISIEGKKWWILKTLPIKDKEILKAKILLNFVLIAPFYVISTVIGVFCLKQNLENIIFIFLVPAAYIIFTTLFALFINLHFYSLEWENETKVIKQSSATMISIFFDMAVVIVPMTIALILNHILACIFMGILVIFLLGLSLILWQVVNKTKLIGLK